MACGGSEGDERSKVASKQTNRNARGSPTVINDHPVVILSPIKETLLVISTPPKPARGATLMNRCARTMKHASQKFRLEK